MGQIIQLSRIAFGYWRPRLSHTRKCRRTYPCQTTGWNCYRYSRPSFQKPTFERDAATARVGSVPSFRRLSPFARFYQPNAVELGQVTEADGLSVFLRTAFFATRFRSDPLRCRKSALSPYRKCSSSNARRRRNEIVRSHQLHRSKNSSRSLQALRNLESLCTRTEWSFSQNA